jgi:hypothetical protein
MLTISGCGGGSPDDDSSPAVSANALNPGATAEAGVGANAAANTTSTGEVANDTTSAATNNAPTYNRVVLRRAGQGD